MAPTTPNAVTTTTTQLLQALPALVARQYTGVRVRRSRRLHPGAIFGIAAGCLLLLVFSAYLIIFCCFRKWYKERRSSGRGIFGIGMRRHGAAGAGNLRHGGGGHGPAHYNRTQDEPQMGYSNTGGGPYGGGQFPGPGMPSGYYSGNQNNYNSHQHQQQTGGVTNGAGGMGGKMDGAGYGGGQGTTTTGNY